MKKVIPLISLFLMASLLFAQNETDSLERILPGTSGLDRVIVLNSLTKDNWLNYPEKAESYAKEALFLARASADSASISKCLRLLGGVYLYQGYPLEAYDYSKQALHLAVSIRDTSLINSALNNLGYTCYHLSNYQSALEYLLESKHLKELTGDNTGLEHTLNNIGLIYQTAEEHSEAIKYFRLGLEQARQNKNIDLQIYSLNNLAASYTQKNELDKAQNLLNKALVLVKTTNNKNWSAVSYFELSQIRNNYGEYDSALFSLKKAINIQKEIKDNKGLAKSSHLKAEILFNKGNPNMALGALAESDSLAEKTNSSEILIDNYLLKFKIFLVLKNTNKAQMFLDHYLKSREDHYQKILKTNLSLVPKKMKEEANKLRYQQAELELKNQKFQNLLYGSVIILILPFSLLLYILYRRNINVNRSLKKQNEMVEAQKEEIETQKEYMEENFKELELAKNMISSQKDELEILNRQLEGKVDASSSELKKVNETLKATSLELDNFIYKSSHDIKGPLVRILGICSLAIQDIEDEKALNYFTMLDKAAKRLNFIIDELKLISEINTKLLRDEEVDFSGIIDNCLKEILYIENISKTDLTVNYDPVKYYGDADLIKLIIFNLLQNSFQILKSEQISDKEVLLNINESNNLIVISLDLIHLRLKTNEISQLVNSFTKANTEFNNLSIGLYTIILCVNKLGGSFEILTTEEGHTAFEVRLPH